MKKLVKTSGVKLEVFNFHWVNKYQEEADKILKILGDKFPFTIEHVGSTSIMGCYSRHAIDLAVGLYSLEDLLEIRNILEAKGFKLWKRYSSIDHVIFLDGQNGGVDFEIHLVIKNSSMWNRMIYFRNFMNQHPNLVKDYSAFKQKLATELRLSFSSYYLSKEKYKDEVLNIK